jgi:hypothetical protein
MSSSKDSTPTISNMRDLLAYLKSIRAQMINLRFGNNVQADVPAILFIIVNLIDQLQNSASAILPPPHVLDFYTTAIDYRVSSSRQNPSTAQHHVSDLRVLLFAMNNAIVTAQPPVAQIPVGSMAQAHNTSQYAVAIERLIQANALGPNPVYQGVLDLLIRLQTREKNCVFDQILRDICINALQDDDTFLGCCASLVEHYHTNEYCMACNSERLPNTGHHESWNDCLCPDCAAARHSGAAPIPVGRSPVARQAPPRCPMCDTGVHRICVHIPPICDGCLHTALQIGSTWCPDRSVVFCKHCRKNHPYPPTR